MIGRREMVSRVVKDATQGADPGRKAQIIVLDRQTMSRRKSR